MSSELLVLTRDVGPAECPWLSRVYQEGDTVYRFRGPTYGSISRTGLACSDVLGEYPFFELPADAVSMFSAGVSVDAPHATSVDGDASHTSTAPAEPPQPTRPDPGITERKPRR